MLYAPAILVRLLYRVFLSVLCKTAVHVMYDCSVWSRCCFAVHVMCVSEGESEAKEERSESGAKQSGKPIINVSGFAVPEWASPTGTSRGISRLSEAYQSLARLLRATIVETILKT